MFQKIWFRIAILVGVLSFLPIACQFSKRLPQPPPPESVKQQFGTIPSGNSASSKEAIVADFEEGNLVNRLQGESGSWNLSSDDPNSKIAISIAEGAGQDGKGNALKIDYRVQSEMLAQNGFWTKLKEFNASPYDHLQFDVRGDEELGFTNVFKIELKKRKGDDLVEKIKGTAIIKNITSEWQTIQIPLNKITGLFQSGRVIVVVKKSALVML